MELRGFFFQHFQISHISARSLVISHQSIFDNVKWFPLTKHWHQTSAVICYKTHQSLCCISVTNDIFFLNQLLFKIRVFIFLLYLIISFGDLHLLNIACVCSQDVGVSGAWSSRSCKCDCEGGESPTEFSSIGTGSSMVRGVDCMPGTVTIQSPL